MMKTFSAAKLAPSTGDRRTLVPVSALAEWERIGKNPNMVRAFCDRHGSPSDLLTRSSLVAYCGGRLPESHFGPLSVVTGMSRSGKTVISDRMFFSRIIADLNGHAFLRHRAFVVEARPGMLQKLRGSVPSEFLTVLDPTLEGSAAPDYPALIDGDWDNAHAFALALVQDMKTGGESDTWAELAAKYLTAIVQVFTSSGADWDLLDLLTAAMTYGEGLIRGFHPFGPQFLDSFIKSNAMGDNTKQTATGVLLTFQDQAFAGRQCEVRWDVRSWAERGGVVALCLDPDRAEAKLPIVRMLSTFAVNAVLSRSRPDGGEPVDRSVFYFDEVQDLRLPILGKAVRMGGAKGLELLLTFQSIPGLVLGYSKEEADDLIANASNIIVCRQNCPESAKRWSDVLGAYEWYEPSVSESFTRSGVKESISYRRHFEPNVPAEVLMSFPRASYHGGITAAHRTPAYPGCVYTIAPDWPARTAPLAASEEETYRRRPRFLPRVGDRLLIWNEDDFSRLGIAPLPPDSDARETLRGAQDSGVRLPRSF